jgi:hypothetical protein
MLRLTILAIALLIDLTLAARAETSGCTQVTNLSTARLSWAAVRKGHADPAHNNENRLLYATNFFEAVTARQAASFCKEGIDRVQSLELIEFEIEAFNDLIGQCAAGNELQALHLAKRFRDQDLAFAASARMRVRPATVTVLAHRSCNRVVEI